MDERLQNLLRSLVDAYVALSSAVGSQYLVEEHGLGVSSATVRNWFAELERQGYIQQPHISGGRIPTEKGFRTYIDLFVESKPASKSDRDRLRKAGQAPKDDGRRFRSIAKELAELSGLAVVVRWKKSNSFYTGLSQLFAQPEFKNLHQVISLSELLDHLDDTLDRLGAHAHDGTRILVGSACPFGRACGSVIGEVEEGMIGILGPMRMEYQRNLSLIHSALEVYSS